MEYASQVSNGVLTIIDIENMETMRVCLIQWDLTQDEILSAYKSRDKAISCKNMSPVQNFAI